MAEGRRTHRREKRRPTSAPLAKLMGAVVGSVLTGIAWIYLVGAAIDFGVVASHGRNQAWLFSLGATVGAAACLVLMLALVGHGLRSLGFLSEYKPRRAGARRRSR